MTDTELLELEQKAKVATPGPWEISRDDFASYIESRKGTVGEISDAFDANYISAANPAVVLELITELRQARKDACEWINIARWLIRKFGRETVETEMILMARHALGYENRWGKTDD